MKKNKIRCLIAIDMDGTLLNDKSKVSFWSKRYLKKSNLILYNYIAFTDTISITIYYLTI